MTHETNVQDNDERAILYSNINVSCKNKGFIQTIVSHSQIYKVLNIITE